MRKLRSSAALATVIATLVWSSPAALADPPPAPEPVVGGAVADAPTLLLADMGAPSQASFVVNRNVSGSSLTFPVPAGLTPVALKAGVELPVNLRFGNLIVSQGDRTIAQVPLPAADQPQLVDVPLAGVQVAGDWVNLSLTVNVIPIDGYCWDRMSPIRLVNAAIAFSGVEVAPTTVAGFLPPVLRKVTIGIPAQPSRAESDAAVQLAAEVANRNGQSPEVVVVPLPDGAADLPGPSAPLERQFIVREGPDNAVWLQGPGVPALRFSGTGEELTRQVRLLGDGTLPLAASPRSTAESLPEPQLASDTTTVADLSGSSLTAEETWPTVKIEIDQTRWGHPVAGVTVHLLGSYTPLPANFGGEVTASVGSETIARWPMEADGVIDRVVTIPDRLLKRVISLDVGLRTTGTSTNCGDIMPVMLRVDGATSIKLKRADQPVPQGFQSLPQALQPRIRIGIGPDAFGDTARAVQIIVGLQRAGGVGLQTEVSGLQDAIASNEPAILISPDGWDSSVVPLPFTTDKGKLTVTGLDSQEQPATVNLDPAAPFGSLQTVFDGRRTLLIATASGGPAILDELLRYMTGPGRWSGLNGRAIISAPGMQPVTIPNPSVDFSTGSQAAGGSDDEDSWFWWAVGGVAVLAGLGAVTILLRARPA